MKKLNSKNIKKILTTGILLAISIFILFIIVKNNKDKQYNETIKLYVGNNPVNELEYAFYYNTFVNSFAQTYSEYLSSLNLDFKKNLYDQPCQFSGYETWGIFFDVSTLNLIQETKSLYSESQINSFVCDYDNEYKEFKNQLKNEAIKNNCTSKEVYYMYYGEQATPKRIKEIFIEYATSLKYKQYLSDNIEVTNEEISNYYNENKGKYDIYDFSVIYITIKDEGNTLTDIEQKNIYNNIKEQTNNSLEKLNNENELDNFIKRYLENENIAYIKKDYNYKIAQEIETIDTDISEQIINKNKKELFLIENDDNFLIKIVLVNNRYANNNYTVKARHILIPIDVAYASSDKDYEKQYETIKKIKSEFLKGKQDENSFARLANKYSKDEGTNKNGGLLSNIPKTKYGEEINSWLFNDTRKYGDCEALKSELGYHLFFFVEKEEYAWQKTIKNQIKEDKYKNIITTINNKYPLSFKE